MVSGAGN